MMSGECLHWCGNASRMDGRSFTITRARWQHRRQARSRGSEDFQDFFVALEGWNEIGAGEFGAGPGEHVAGYFETTIARGGPCGLHRFEQRLRDDDAGHFVVQAQRLLVAVERPDADQHRDRRLAAEFFQKSVPVLGVEERLGHRVMRAGFDLGVEALDFVVEIVGYRIQCHADLKIRGAPESFSCPVGALIQAIKNFDKADGVDFVDAAGFRVITYRRWITCDSEHVADATDGPRAEKRSLQADDVLVARREMRNGFDAAGFQRAGHNQGVHANAGHGSAIDVDGVHFFGRHNLVDLLEDAVERESLGRIDFYADGEFFFLEFFPELALRLAMGSRRWS